MKGRAIWTTLGFVLLLNLLGVASAGLSGPMAGGDWYQALRLPVLQPPGPVFGIAWTLLYSLLGLALARLWLAPPSPARRRALLLFVVQLGLNLAWSPLFFGNHQILGALLLIILVLAAAVAATVAAGRVDRVAPWAMLPYLIWLGFALGLNWRIWQMNPGA